MVLTAGSTMWPAGARVTAHAAVGIALVATATAGLASAARGQPVRAQQAGSANDTGRPREAANPGAAWFGFRLRPSGPAGGQPVVNDVYPGSPAENAGLRAGDTLIRLGGGPATRPALAAVVARLAPGDTVGMLVRHGLATYAVSLRAAPRPPAITGTATAPGVLTFRLDALRGLVLGQLSAATARVTVIAPAGSAVEATDSGVVFRNPQRGLRVRLDTLIARGRRLRPGDVVADSTAGAPVRLARVTGRALDGMTVAPLPPGGLARGGPDAGVLVLAVRPRSAAARAGLQPLDVVVRAGGAPVSTVDALERVLRGASQAGSRPVLLSVRRGGISLDVLLVPAARDKR